ncbi:MAG TPA: MFS transporter [Planctomycetes bacterium]|nr:MFS transporter [Planctomycetota bacterium]
MTDPTSTRSSKPTNFGFIYWVANWMELVERFAYYGVRVVLPVFMVEAISNGGPEFTHIQKGTIYAIWALVQSFVPIFTGGLADRYGFKVNIAVSTVLKIIGYLIMGYAITIGEMVSGLSLAEARPDGLDNTYEIFFAGAMFLALGTAIFKPGLQGLIAHQMPVGKESLGWGMFYQMVNIGGFIGPMLAGYLRVLDWEYVFLACAAGIALNFIPLFVFKEPHHDNVDDNKSVLQVVGDAFTGLLEPRLFFFTMAFAGFWLMFYQLFDILPNFIDDWIDSREVVAFLGGADSIPTVNGGNLTQEWMLNFNALLISFFAFAMGWVTGKVRSLNAIVVGIGVSAIAIYALGMSANGWWCLAAIGLFSFGEMTASPTKMRYLAGIAPAGKEGLYMGYVNFTVGIGWSIGSVIAGNLYEEGGDKINLAKRYLIDKSGVAAEKIDTIARADILPFFTETTGLDAWQTRTELWNTYEPQSMWAIFTAIGVGSMVAIMIYNKVVTAANRNPEHTFNVSGQNYVTMALVPISLAFWFGAYSLEWDDMATIVQAILFSSLWLVSFNMQRNTN